MMVEQIIFYIFSAITLAASFMVIITHDPVKSALSLILAFLASSGLWLLAGAEFLALVLILVYVGAVMTLFLFVVMMIKIEKKQLKTNIWQYAMFSFVLVSIMAYCMYLGIKQAGLTGRNIFDREIIDNISAIGNTLYTDFALSFIVSGILLLCAIIGSIAIVHRQVRDRKSQDMQEQLQTKKSDRIRLVG